MARDVSSPEKGGGFAFFNVGTIMMGGGVRGADAVQEDVWVCGVRPSGASSRRVLGFWVQHMQGSFTTTMRSRWGSVLGAYACACFHVCVLGSCVLVSRVRNADVATDVLGMLDSCIYSMSLLKKKWSDARAAWNFRIHEQGELTRLEIYFYVTAI